MGYVKLHRKMLSWEWIGDANVVAVFVNILLRVNREAKRWKGIDIPTGSYFTSRHNLALACGLTDKQVRRALDLLEKGRTIERKRAGSGMLITLVKWDEYQLGEVNEGRTRATSRATIRAGRGPQAGPDEGRKRATTKEVEKERSREVENTSPSIEGEEPSAVGGQDRSTVQAPPDPTPGSAAPLPGEEPKADHRDPRINELVDYLEKKLGHGLDGSAKANRFAASTLLKILAREFPGFDALASTKALIDAATVDPFHAKNATNFDYLRRHWGAIAKASKERKSQTKHQTNDEYAKSVAAAFARKYGITDPARS